MVSRRAKVAASAAAGLAAGILYPVVDLALACRNQASEACVWGKAYLPLTFGLSIVLLGGAVAAAVFLALSWRERNKRG